VVDLEGIISKKHVSILIDPSSNLIYLLPQVVETCALQRKKHAKACSLHRKKHAKTVPYIERSMQKHGWFN
jgi:hypothetical protein